MHVELPSIKRPTRRGNSISNLEAPTSVLVLDNGDQTPLVIATSAGVHQRWHHGASELSTPVLSSRLLRVVQQSPGSARCECFISRRFRRNVVGDEAKTRCHLDASSSWTSSPMEQSVKVSDVQIGISKCAHVLSRTRHKESVQRA
ncbi:hypothetical protein F441_05298 [Phytophthora nicotianae CJ01A1]|uniref:Uncharacterized protein n=3 Tax=Phytophthora nicotianae TaxID=4792 RepID=V9FIK1_PHYNI|nr:hypothetical protein F443_05295 [Phytophthora nicotianae P1569]ETL44621.1 hypothetical protein L916_05109 [Phytophthora nicotianae]ETP21107.1 hypothetical protein F441_05298 [Phytophthora nicotianae CJ01A1]